MSNERVSAKEARENRAAAQDLALQVATLCEGAIGRMPTADALLGAMGGVLNVARGAMKPSDLADWLKQLSVEVRNGA